MPIRINLLAEQKVADDLRRRDPVKRALWVAGGFVGALIVWASVVQVQLMSENAELRSQEARYAAIEKTYQGALNSQNQVMEHEQKLAALDRLRTNRFLWANALNALQFTAVDNLRITRLKAEQVCTVTEATKPTKSGGGSKPGVPASSQQDLSLVIDARDLSSKAGEQIFRFQESITNQPFFLTNALRVELTGRSPVQSDPSEPNKPFIAFTLDCRFPERVHKGP